MTASLNTDQTKKICTRCGYKRRESDDSVVPETECPKCRIVYQKFESSMLAFDMVISEKKIMRSAKKRKNKGGYIMMLFIVFASLFVIGFVSGRSYSKYELQREARSGFVQSQKKL